MFNPLAPFSNTTPRPTTLIEPIWYLPKELLTIEFDKFLEGDDLPLPLPIQQIIDHLEIQEIPSLLKNIVKLKKHFPDIDIPAPIDLYDISKENHPDIKTALADFYEERLRRLNNIAGYYFNVSYAAREALRKRFAEDFLCDYELFTQMKENGDIEVCLGWTPTDHEMKKNLGYDLMKFTFELVISLFADEYRIENIDDKGFEVILQRKDFLDHRVYFQLAEEEEEESFRIEIFIGERRITLRSLMSFQLDEEKPFHIDNQDLLYHQRLSHCVIYFAYQNQLLPQSAINLTADIYPFLVNRFLKALRNQGPIRAPMIDLFADCTREYSNRQNLALALHEASEFVKDLNGLACLNKDPNHCRRLNSNCSLYEGYEKILEAFTSLQN